MIPERPVAAIARRVYSIALRMWAGRGSEYIDDMRLTFSSLCDDAQPEGAAAVIALLGRELVDLAHARVAAAARRWRPRATAIRTTRRAAVSAVFQDVRYAFRTLIRQPGFAFVSIVTLALGIGATTAVFTVVNGVLMRPLPYADPSRLVILLNGRNGRLVASFSPPNYRDATAADVFAASAAFNNTTLNLTGTGDPERLEGVDVTTAFFDVLGVSPRLGRAFVASDAQPGALVVIISDGLWRRLGTRSEIVGSTLQLDGKPYTVIGVARDNTFPVQAAFWRPLIFTAHQLDNSQRGAQWVNAIARLKPDVELEQASAAVATIARRLEKDFPSTNRERQMVAVALKDRIVRNVRPALLMLFAAVSLVLLIACVNVANLLLARAQARTREVVVRAAVGAGRARLVQQFLVESVVLALLGAAAGLLLAWWSTRVLIALGTTSIPRLEEVAIDWRVLLFTLATATTTGGVFGLVPAAANTGAASARSLAGRGAVGAGGSRLRRTLVVAELALAVVLLVGAGLLLRSYERIRGVHPGFTADGVLTFRLALPESKYPDGNAAAQFVGDYVHGLSAIPGVQSASAVFGLPLDDDFNAFSTFTRRGEQNSDNEPTAGMRIITPDYLRTLNIPLRAGRTFDDRDTAASPEVVLINEEAARRYWPDRNPIGQQIHLGARLTDTRSGQKTIVGVVGDVKYGGLDVTAPPEVYLPHTQHPVAEITIAVRTAGDPITLVPTARAALKSMDRELPISAVRLLADVVSRSIAERRFVMLLLACFAAVAVALAVIGVYGVLAYLVSQRTQEIGVRLAIGATPRDVVRLIVREGVALAGVGLLVGCLGALAAARVLSTMLFGIGAGDPLTFAAVVVVLTAAALCASYLPARRAARVDPMQALRAE